MGRKKMECDQEQVLSSFHLHEGNNQHPGRKTGIYHETGIYRCVLL